MASGDSGEGTTSKTAIPPATKKKGGSHVSAKEIELLLSDGMLLRGQHWTHRSNRSSRRTKNSDYENTTKILALHGWLDNCRSFYYLAPKLVERLCNNPETPNAELVAIDLPGHGLSSHRPPDGPTAVLSEGTYYIAEILQALGWVGAENTFGNNNKNSSSSNNNKNSHSKDDEKVALIGHSMGGGMAITYAGVFPEQVSKVVSLDIYGPEPASPRNAAAHIRAHVTQRRMGKRPPTLYPSLERAIERRQKAATLALGGHQYLSRKAATELVSRSIEPVYNADDCGVRGYQFRHDMRLNWPSLQYLTSEQVQSILDKVDCPVCLLAAQDGYPFARDRIDRVLEALKPQIYEVLPGSHHLHADPESADAVVDQVYEFFCRDGGNNDG
jgi:pimeloyl-ACP methyl ester carboxylesterase